MVNGFKGTMWEGGSRVPYIASWPGVTPAGKVSKDIVSFADQLPTFAELGGAKLPEGVKIDGQTFAPQLRGQPGKPREYAYAQLGAHWFVREPGWKLNEAGVLFDMSDAPFVEKPVAAEADTEASKAARVRLAAVLKELNPSAGKQDAPGEKLNATGE
jgi:arylsulfatase A